MGNRGQGGEELTGGREKGGVVKASLGYPHATLVEASFSGGLHW